MFGKEKIGIEVNIEVLIELTKIHGFFLVEKLEGDGKVFVTSGM